jgi:hypothetical protein
MPRCKAKSRSGAPELHPINPIQTAVTPHHVFEHCKICSSCQALRCDTYHTYCSAAKLPASQGQVMMAGMRRALTPMPKPSGAGSSPCARAALSSLPYDRVNT